MINVLVIIALNRIGRESVRLMYSGRSVGSARFTKRPKHINNANLFRFRFFSAHYKLSLNSFSVGNLQSVFLKSRTAYCDSSCSYCCPLLSIMSGAAQCNWFLSVLSPCKCKLAIFCETNTDDWCGLRYLFYYVSRGENYSREG